MFAFRVKCVLDSITISARSAIEVCEIGIVGSNYIGDGYCGGVTTIRCVRISNPEHRIEHWSCPLLRFNANIAAACACSGLSST